MSSIVSQTNGDKQKIEYQGKQYLAVKEGRAKVLVPNHPVKGDSESQKKRTSNEEIQSVFYNPIQQFNRDLSVLAIRVFGRDLLARRALKAHSKREKKRSSRAGQRTEPQEQVESKNHLKRKADQALCEHDDASEAVVEGDDVQAGNTQNESGMCWEKHVPEDGNMQDRTVASEKSGVFQRAVKDEQVQLARQGQRFTILDALSATGLRALRYASEIPFATKITANDLSEGAVKAIGTNVQYNKLDGKITATVGDAMTHMYSHSASDGKHPQHGNKYDVIDLDPYGTAAPFFDAAVQATTDGGMVCVTCTDAGVWASNGYPEKAFALYGGVTMKGFHSHEAGLRLIVQAVANSAARYGMAIEPLLSLSIDYYCRIFIRVRRSQAEAKFAMGKSMVVYTCDAGCGAWQTQFLGRHEQHGKSDSLNPIYKHSYALAPTCEPYCAHCGFKTHLGGPMYGGPLHNASFIRAVLREVDAVDDETYQTRDRLRGMLTTALDETTVDHGVLVDEQDIADPSMFARVSAVKVDRHPFFFNVSTLSRVLHCQAPADALIKGALRHAGYIATRSHAKPNSIKTDAPWSFIWHMMREWVRQRAPLKGSALREGTAGYGLLNRATSATSVAPSSEPGIANGNSIGDAEIVFDEELGRDKSDKRLRRYQVNPREDWGPQRRARG